MNMRAYLLLRGGYHGGCQVDRHGLKVGRRRKEVEELEVSGIQGEAMRTGYGHIQSDRTGSRGSGGRGRQ